MCELTFGELIDHDPLKGKQWFVEMLLEGRVHSLNWIWENCQHHSSMEFK